MPEAVLEINSSHPQMIGEILDDLDGFIVGQKARRKSGISAQVAPSLIYIFEGPERCGQAESAKAIATRLREAGLIESHELFKLAWDDLAASLPDLASPLPLLMIETKASAGDKTASQQVASATPTGSKLSKDGADALEALLRANVNSTAAVILSGDQFGSARESIEHSGALRSCVRKIVAFEPPTPAELAERVISELSTLNYETSEEVAKLIASTIGRRTDLRLEDAKRIASDIGFQQTTRSGRLGGGAKSAKGQITAEDVASLSIDGPSRSPEEILKDFEKLVGAQRIQKKMEVIAASASRRAARAQAGFEGAMLPEHFALIGPPGTGKTTAARMIGELLAAVGLLKRGHLVERDRTTLVAEYIGQSEARLREAIKEAEEGVLFIDEAYALGGSESRHGLHSLDFGLKVIDGLVAAISNEAGPRFTLVVAGYPDEMAGFFQTNPGIESRIRTRIDFSAYSDDELLEIVRKRMTEDGLAEGDDFVPAFRDAIGALRDSRGPAFGNARDAIGLVCDQAFQVASDRDHPDPLVTTICGDDLRSAMDFQIGNPTEGEPASAGHRPGQQSINVARALLDDERLSEAVRSAIDSHLSEFDEGAPTIGFGARLPRSITDVFVDDAHSVSLDLIADVLGKAYGSRGVFGKDDPVKIDLAQFTGRNRAAKFLEKLESVPAGICTIQGLTEFCDELSNSNRVLLSMTDELTARRNQTLFIVQGDTGGLSQTAEGKLLLAEFELIID